MLQNIMLNKNLLITGGTGSFGQAVKRIIEISQNQKIGNFIRDELKQHQMSLNLSLSDLEKVSCFF